MACEFVNLVDVSAHKVLEFLGQRNELFFSLVMEKMQLVVVLPCYFCNKHFVHNVTWKESKIFLGAKNPNHTAILHLFKCPLLVQKIGCLVRHAGSILS